MALGASYVLVARIGLSLDAVGGLATLVWPSTGLALAALVVLGRWAWPGIALGALFVNLWVGAPPAVAVGIAAGNTLEALLGAYALSRVGFERSLQTLRSAIALIALAALGSTLVSASIGTLSMTLGGVVPPARLGSAWLAWWLGNVIGDLIVAPFLLTLSVPAPRWTRGRVAESALMIALLGVLGALVFGQQPGAAIGPLRQPHMVIPLLLWAALRFGPRGASGATLLTSVVAITGTALGRGPLPGATLYEQLLGLQGFMAMAACTTLTLSAVVAERRALLVQEQSLRTAAERAVRVRDEFLAIASHELRTPLTPLKLQLDGLVRALGDADARIRSRMESALRQTDNLIVLAERLLDVTRIAAGRLDLEIERVNLAELVAEVVDQHRDAAAKAESTLTLSGPAFAVGALDRTRVAQALANLLSNAVRYGRGKPVEIVLGQTEDAFDISVRDSGVGIPREALGRIFERFERAASAKEHGGLGLGLYLARENRPRAWRSHRRDEHARYGLHLRP